MTSISTLASIISGVLTYREGDAALMARAGRMLRRERSAGGLREAA